MFNKQLLINHKFTIKEAMEALDKTAEKVLLVVDDGQALIGTLTDGDIRRHILKGWNLSGTIRDAFHTKPIFITPLCSVRRSGYSRRFRKMVDGGG